MDYWVLEVDVSEELNLERVFFGLKFDGITGTFDAHKFSVTQKWKLLYFSNNITQSTSTIIRKMTQKNKS